MRKHEEDYTAMKRSIERFTLRLRDNKVPDLALGYHLYIFGAIPGGGVAGAYKLSARNLRSYDPLGSGVFKLPRDGY